MNDSQRPEPPSPCVQICTLDVHGDYCLGCLRTLTEIAAWSDLSRARRWQLLDDLQRRAERQFVDND